MIYLVILAIVRKIRKECGYDYGQCWDRQSLRKDFNPDLTKSKVLHYNNKEVH